MTPAVAQRGNEKTADAPRGKVWKKAPSPCIGVCKFRDAGRCLGCSMTKPEKKAFKRLSGKAEKKTFFVTLMGRLRENGRLDYWSRMYRRRCAKKARPCPLDRIDAPELRDAA